MENRQNKYFFLRRNNIFTPSPSIGAVQRDAFVHSPSVDNLFGFRYSFASFHNSWLETDSTWWQNVIRTQLDCEASNAGAQHCYPLCSRRSMERQKRPLTGKIDKIFVFQFSSYFLCVFMVDIQRACRLYYRRNMCYYLHKLSADAVNSPSEVSS